MYEIHRKQLIPTHTKENKDLKWSCESAKIVKYEIRDVFEFQNG